LVAWLCVLASANRWSGVRWKNGSEWSGWQHVLFVGLLRTTGTTAASPALPRLLCTMGNH